LEHAGNREHQIADDSESREAAQFRALLARQLELAARRIRGGAHAVNQIRELRLKVRAKFLEVQTDVVARVILDQRYSVGIEYSAAKGRKPDGAKRLAGLAVPKMSRGEDLHVPQTHRQNSESAQNTDCHRPEAPVALSKLVDDEHFDQSSE
jgi:hypothetical protein